MVISGASTASSDKSRFLRLKVVIKFACLSCVWVLPCPVASPPRWPAAWGRRGGMADLAPRFRADRLHGVYAGWPPFAAVPHRRRRRHGVARSAGDALRPDGGRGRAGRRPDGPRRADDPADPGPVVRLDRPGKSCRCPGTVQRDRNTWQVPVDFIRRRSARRSNVRVEIRRPSRLILVGDVRVPQISGRSNGRARGGRLIVEISRPRRTRSRARATGCVVRFDAAALDAAPIAGIVPEFVDRTRVDGTTLVDRSRAAAVGRPADSDGIDTASRSSCSRRHLPPPPPPPTVRRRPPAPGTPGGRRRRRREPPIVDVGPAGAIRTVVIDPGHGGDDAGAQGAGGDSREGPHAADGAAAEGRDREPHRPARAAHARRRRERAARSAHGARQQQQGRSVHQPARQRVGARRRRAARRCCR